MGRTSSKVKQKYNSKAYDRLGVFVFKGQSAILSQYAEAKGLSKNALVNRAVAELMEREPVEGLKFIPVGQEAASNEDSKTQSED